VRPLELAALAAVLLAPAGARAAPPLLYVALGDSTAAGTGAEQGGGYPERIARRLGESGVPVRLVNLGVPGATTADLRRAQLPRVLAERPGFVTIGIGINDLMQGRALGDFSRDLHVVADLIARTKATVVISEIPDLSVTRVGADGGPSPQALARRVAAYNAAIRQVAERHGFAVAEVEASSRRAFREDAGLLSRDGFHPSSRGYEVWAAAMWPTIERALAPRVQARRPAPQGAAVER
jgi:lysophospholipase L1-like esterase